MVQASEQYHHYYSLLTTTNTIIFRGDMYGPLCYVVVCTTVTLAFEPFGALGQSVVEVVALRRDIYIPLYWCSVAVQVDSLCKTVAWLSTICIYYYLS